MQEHRLARDDNEGWASTGLSDKVNSLNALRDKASFFVQCCGRALHSGFVQCCHRRHLQIKTSSKNQHTAARVVTMTAQTTKVSHSTDSAVSWTFIVAWRADGGLPGGLVGWLLMTEPRLLTVVRLIGG